MTRFGKPIFTKWLVVVRVPPPTPTFVAPIEVRFKSATTLGDTELWVAPVSKRALYFVPPEGFPGRVNIAGGNNSTSATRAGTIMGYRQVNAVAGIRGCDGVMRLR